MNKFAFNLSKFKKIGGDKNHTMLQHEAGHTLKIAHAPLSPKLRGQLASLSMPKSKMAGGGSVQDDEIIKEKNDTDAQNAQRMESGEEQLPYTPKVEAKLKSTDITPRRPMADGGKPNPSPTPSPDDENKKKTVGSIIGYPGMAEGGDVDLPPVPEAMQQANMIPDNIAPQPGEQPYGTPDPASQAVNKLTSDIAAERKPALTDATPMGATNGQNPPDSALSSASPQDSSAIGTPDLAHGYQSQVQGTLDAAKAEAAGQNVMAAIAQHNAAQQQKILDHYNQAGNILTNEFNSVRDDIKNGHIDPNQYISNMSTGSKIASGIGLLLAGLGGNGINGQQSAPMAFLNKQIENNIEAQKAELGKKQNLLSAYMHQFGNLHDATQMAMATQKGIMADQIMAQAAQTNNPVIMARAQAAVGQLEQQVAPTFQQLAMRQALEKGSAAGSVDPSAYVRFVVPEPHQKEVFGEIERAQDTRRMSNAILKGFDEASKDNTVLKTGAGVLRTPASVYALHQALQPTFKDLEGTVRQAAMDNTFKNVTPAPGDMASTVATKRAALVDYLKSKASAPTAKGFGIDLDKFQSTHPMDSAPMIKNYKGVPHQLNPSDNKWYPVKK